MYIPSKGFSKDWEKGKVCLLTLRNFPSETFCIHSGVKIFKGGTGIYSVVLQELPRSIGEKL